MTLANRNLGSFSVPPVGLGCMNLSHAYGVPPSDEDARRVLQKGIDLGIRHFDSAALYGFGNNEKLVGPFLEAYRDDVLLVSKCGLRGENGVRTMDGRPEKLRDDLESSLRRLRTEVIDLYYLHRYDKITPIEDSIGQMSRFVEEGKVIDIGVSEMSARTIRRAHAVHPLAAVQSEYSLWSRNVEIGVLDVCEELGIAFVAFSPVARGFLTDTDVDPEGFAENDLRRNMPRFQAPHLAANHALLKRFREIAADLGCTAAQLSLAWLLRRAPFMHVIPGTTSVAHLEENTGALDVELDDDTCAALDQLINSRTISGLRYNAATQAEIDTEQFDFEIAAFA